MLLVLLVLLTVLLLVLLLLPVQLLLVVRLCPSQLAPLSDLLLRPRN